MTLQRIFDHLKDEPTFTGKNANDLISLFYSAANPCLRDIHELAMKAKYAQKIIGLQASDICMFMSLRQHPKLTEFTMLTPDFAVEQFDESTLDKLMQATYQFQTPECKVGARFSLAYIHDLLPWPLLGSMVPQHEHMIEEGDWSGIRDAEPEQHKNMIMKFSDKLQTFINECIILTSGAAVVPASFR